MATKVEFKKAKTCQHAYDVTTNGGVMGEKKTRNTTKRAGKKKK